MRILHLIDPAAPGGGPCTLKLLAETLTRVAGRHDVLIAGTTDHIALARRCGLAPLGRIRAPLNRPTLARAAIADSVTKLFYKHIPDELGSRLTPR